MSENETKASGAMSPNSFASKLDYQSLIFRQSDRICYLLAISLNTTDTDRGSGPELKVRSAIFAISQSINAFEALLLPKMVSSGIYQDYLVKKQKILTPRWAKIENSAMAGAFLNETQRLYIATLLQLYGLQMLQVHRCGLVRGEARKLRSGDD